MKKKIQNEQKYLMLF